MSDDDKKEDTQEEAQKSPEPDVLPPELDTVHESYDPDKDSDREQLDSFKD